MAQVFFADHLRNIKIAGSVSRMLRLVYFSRFNVAHEAHVFPPSRKHFFPRLLLSLCTYTAASTIMFLAPLQAASRLGECPQPRFTGKAPDEYFGKKNPLGGAVSDLVAAERLYMGETDNANCAICHGKKGDGKGVLASQYDPPPRNFSCAKTVDGVPDGQLFWIIRNGSPGTSMPPHQKLADAQIWQLVSYLRKLAK